MSDRSNILLTIGIPTYNNPKGLERQLKNFATQIKEKSLQDKVEILVSDNSDNDETKHVIKSFLGTDIQLAYIKNPFNIGYDRNVDQVLSKSAGDYCWTLSDNDPVEANAIEKIIYLLESNTEIGHIIIDTTKKIPGPKIYSNYEALVLDNDNVLTGGMISQNIFNTHLLPKDRAKYYDNLWFHLSLLLEIGAKKTFLSVPSIFLDNDDKECRWAVNGTTFITYTNLLTILKELEQMGYSNGFAKNQIHQLKKGFSRQIITGKLHGLKVNKKSLNILYYHSKDNFIYLFIRLMILITPTIIFRVMKNFKSI